MHDERQIISLPVISRNHLLQQRLILDFLLVIIAKNVFFACYFWNKLNAKPSLQNQLS